MAVQPDGVEDRLRNDTEHFLRRHYFNVAAGAGVAAVTTYHIRLSNIQPQPHPGRYLGRLRMHRPNAFDALTVAPPNGPHPTIDAMRIPIDQYNNGLEDNIPGTGLAVVGGSDFMFTGLLTGCTFCYYRGPAFTWVAHIHPNGNNPNNVRANLANGEFIAAINQPIACYGPGVNYNANIEEVQVIGFRTHGRWDFYGQRRPLLSRTITALDPF